MATASNEISRKITIATVTGGARKWFNQLTALALGNATAADKSDAHGSIPLMAVYGRATGVSHGSTEFGEFTKFHGNFRAVNLVPKEDGTPNGEVTNSGQVLLPPHLNGMLEGALRGDGAVSVEFAFEIHAKYDNDAATKYTYTVLDRMPIQPASDPLLQLEVAMGLKPASELQLTNTPNAETGEVAAPAASPAPSPAPAAATSKKR